MKPIYKPKGAALEYCDWALNIYKGCPHACFYCYCPKVLHKDPKEFFSGAEARKNIVEEVRKQVEGEKIVDRTIHLCFAGDPYPTGWDSTPTREIIKILKDSGNHVQILTKGDGRRDFDLLDGEDWNGVTIDGLGPEMTFVREIEALREARKSGIRTWVSFEPVVDVDNVMQAIRLYHPIFDKVKIGKLNYYPSENNWKEFGEEVEELCKKVGLEYYIKNSLRMEMEK